MIPAHLRRRDLLHRLLKPGQLQVSLLRRCVPPNGFTQTPVLKNASQIVLGVPAYGRSFYVSTTNAVGASGTLALYPQFDKTRQPAGDSDEPGDGPSKHNTFLFSKYDVF